MIVSMKDCLEMLHQERDELKSEIEQCEHNISMLENERNNPATPVNTEAEVEPTAPKKRGRKKKEVATLNEFE